MLLVGHRGARFEAPENTVPGFRYAVELGLPAVELDVRMTADDQLVVMHDETIDRTTDGRGKVSELSLRQIQRFDARAIFPEWPEPCRVPTLGEVLEVVDALPNLIVEIKSDSVERLERIVPATLSEVRRRNLADRVTITSFDPVALAISQREAPSIRRGYIGNWDSEQFLDRAVELGCGQADLRHSTGSPELVARAKGLGMRLICWPTNSREDLESVLRFEPDFLCTDQPTLLRALLAELAEMVPPIPASA